MKQVITALLILLYASISYAEDVLIFHQSYGNTHNKWKNRLEDAGHTLVVTSDKDGEGKIGREGEV